MSRRSNEKGGEFERSICRRLSRWITGNEHPELFWRSATSGAKAVSDSKAGRKAHMGGDIMAVLPEGQWFTSRFSVECKDRADFGRIDLLLHPSPNIGKIEFWHWWLGCCSDADRDGKIPIMFFKRLHNPILVSFPDLEYLPTFTPPSIKMSGIQKISETLHQPRVALLESFLDFYPAKAMRMRVFGT